MKIPMINNTILWVALAVLVALQLNTCLSKVHKPEQMIRNEERLKYLEQERLQDSVASVQRIATIDSFIVLSQLKFIELENKKQPIRNEINKVSNAVDNFDKEQLRRSSTEYFNTYH